jgi:cell wall-associated NlpC family hydrolase
LSDSTVRINFFGDSAGAVRATGSVTASLATLQKATASATAETVVMAKTVTETAAANVGSAAKQRESLQALANEYRMVAASAKAGSAEQIAASKLAADAQNRLAFASSGAASAHARHKRELGDLEKSARGGIGAFTGLGRAMFFASNAFLSGVVIGETLHKIYDATMQLEDAQKQLGNTVKNQGQNWTGMSAQVAVSIGKLSDLSKFTKTDLTLGLTQLDMATKDVTLSLKDEVIATNLARQKHLDLATAVKDVVLVSEGHSAILRRQGIVLPQVATAQDALKVKLAELKSEGMQVTEASKLHAEALAKESDSAKTAALDMEVLGRKVAGADVVFGTTSAGHLADLKKNTDDLAISLGKVLVPEIDKGVEHLDHWVQEQVKSGNAQRDLKQLLDVVKGAFQALWPVVDHGARALKAISDAVGGWKVTFEIVLSGLLAKKLLEVASAVALIGTNAERAAGASGVARLILALEKVAGFGALGAVGAGALAYGGPITAAGMLSTKPGPVGSTLPRGQGSQIARMPDGSFVIVGPKGTVPYSGSFYTPSGRPTSTSVYGGAKGAAGALSDPLAGLKTKGASTNISAGRQKLVDLAMSMLGTPYAWGGAGPGGFDCSGLVMWAFAQQGVTLPHFTGSQFKLGQPVSAANMKKGDVVFTEFKKGVPQHEGMYAGGGMVVEAPHTGDKVKTVPFFQFVGGQQYGIRSFLPGGGGTSGRATLGTLKDFELQFGPKPHRPGDLLPVAYQLAIAKAGVTPGEADDKAALTKAIAYLREAVTHLKGKSAVAGYNELASLVSQLAGLTKAPPKDVASKSTLIGLGHTLGVDQSKFAKDKGLLETFFPGFTAKTKAEFEAIAQELKSKLLTHEQVATIRANLSDISSAVGQHMQKIKAHFAAVAAVARQSAQDARQAFADMASAIRASIVESSQDWVAPSQHLLDMLEQSTQASDDAFRIEQAQKKLADAMTGGEEFAQQKLSQIQKLTGQYALASGIDAAQSAVLGIASTFGTSQDAAGIMKQMQGVLAQPFAPNPDQVKQAQQELFDAQRQQEIDRLRIAVQEETAAHKDQVEDLKRTTEQILRVWQDWLDAMLKKAGDKLTPLGAFVLADEAGFAARNDVYLQQFKQGAGAANYTNWTGTGAGGGADLAALTEYWKSLGSPTQVTGGINTTTTGTLGPITASAVTITTGSVKFGVATPTGTPTANVTTAAPAAAQQKPEHNVVNVTLSGGLSEQKIDAKIEGAINKIMVLIASEADRRRRSGL